MFIWGVERKLCFAVEDAIRRGFILLLLEVIIRARADKAVSA